MRKPAALIALVALAVAFAASSVETRAQQMRDNRPDLTIDAATRAEVIETAIKQLNERYIFPDLAKKMEQSLRDHAARKDYDSVTSAKQFA
ncbi:MAG TPA: hypothetical protein VGV59_01865 [Pyrinomonadaceae bacterium]|nr:hypothetical protein [Pyrinomonadaceae bacterium]